MKRILYRFLSLGLLIVSALWPTSCKRIVDLDANPVSSSTNGDVIGQVILPQGTAWNTDELTVLSGFGEYKVSHAKFNITSIDTSSYKLLVTNFSDGTPSLICPLFKGQSKVELSSTSTALGLLMINPAISQLLESEKIKMADVYRKHPQFGQLVSEVESLIRLKKPLADKTNTSLITTLKAIQNNTFKNGRLSFKQGPLGNEKILSFDIGLSGGIIIQNESSFLPYVAGVFDSTGKELTTEPLSLSNLRFDNFTTNDLAKSAIKLFIERPNSLDACYRDFVNRGNGSNPITVCGSLDFFTLKYPIAESYLFTQKGRYTIKAGNAFATGLSEKMTQEVTIATTKLFVNDLLSLFNPEFGKLFKRYDCIYQIAYSLTVNLFKSISSFLLSDEFSWWDLSKLLVSNLQTVFKKSNDCALQAGFISYGGTVIQLLGFLDVFDRAGSGVNLWFMRYSALHDQYYYEYCVTVGPNGTVYCADKPLSEDTPLPNQVEEASTSVSTADPHMTTFDRGRYDFMAVGEFVAAKSTTDNFQVQVRQAPYPSSTQISVNTGIAMLVDNDRVCVYPGPSRLYVNNQAINLSFTEYPLSGGGSIQYTNGNLSIKNRNGDRIEVKLLSNDLDYFITPAKNRSGKLAGLFGNYDGNPSNDLVQANGTRISNTYRELYPAFADSWRITQNQSLFVYETGKTTDSYTDKNFPRSEIQLTASQRAAAEQTCRQAGVTDPDALEGCIVDVALTGNQTFVERAKQNQIISNAKSILSASNFSQYRNEFTLSADATVNGSTVLLNSKGTIGWNDAYLNRDGYETEIVLSVNAPTPCFPLFDINVIDNTAAGDPNQNYLRLSANAGKTQVELVNSGSQPQQHPVNLFDGNRHRIRIATTKALSGSQTTVRILIYIDNYEPLTINRSYASSSLAGYLYPLLKNETINCSNGQITIFGWSFKSQ